VRSGRPLPLEALTAFVQERRHEGSARRLAFDLIAGVAPERAQELVGGFLDDPANELRREAVQQALDQAAALRAAADAVGARARYQTALDAARDVDQIEAAAKALRELGAAVDLSGRFGWLTRWQVIGPFDNTGRAGFDTVFAPERQLALDAEAPGKSGPVRWRALVTTNEYGLVNFNEPFGPLKEVTAYALAEIDAAEARPAEIRLGCKNAWKVWLNGRFLFGRDEYHRNIEIDQYRLPVQLQAGRNQVLVKACQNEQTEDWTVEWEFQLRITDATGKPMPTADSRAVPTPEAR
jgi:hypothetical protein